jgi:hypothetical protein
MSQLSMARARHSLTHVSVICWVLTTLTLLISQGLAQPSTPAPVALPSLIPVRFTVSPLSVRYFGSVVVTVNITQPPNTTNDLVTGYTTTNGPDDVAWPQANPTTVIYTRSWRATGSTFSVGNFQLSGPANGSYRIINNAPINVTLVGIAITVTQNTATPVGDGNYSAVVFVTLTSFPTDMPAATLTLTPNLGGANGAVHDLILTRGVGYLTFDQNTPLTQNFTISAPNSTYQVPLTFTRGGSVAYAYAGPNARNIQLAPRTQIVPLSSSSTSTSVSYWGTWTYSFNISRLLLPWETLDVNLT